jgi:hypothetical protein
MIGVRPGRASSSTETGDAHQRYGCVHATLMPMRRLRNPRSCRDAWLGWLRRRRPEPDSTNSPRRRVAPDPPLGQQLPLQIQWGKRRTWTLETPPEPKGVFNLAPHRSVLDMKETGLSAPGPFFTGTWNGTEYLGVLLPNDTASVAPGNCP